jgi:hypothetical protein
VSTDDDELLDHLRANLAVVPVTPPADAVAALRAAVARSAAANGHRPAQVPAAVPRHRLRTAGTAGHHRRRRVRARWQVPVAAAAGAALALTVGFTGGRLLRGDGGGSGTPPVIEYAGPLLAPDGSVGADVTVEKVGIGRVITFESDRLPILPAGELYEVWFVGPDDAPDAPQRISAGTFHPDPDGRSSVELVAAVDPALYPDIVVTAEPAGGDPAPNGPEVLRASVPPPGGS